MRRLPWVWVAGFAALVTGCLANRDLSYTPGDDPSKTSSTVSGGEASLDGGASTEASSADGGAAVKKPGPTKDAGTDSGASLPPGTCAPGASSEREPNDDAPKGNPLAAGTVCGELVVGLDVDWFRFDLGDQGSTTLRFETEGDAYIAILGIKKSDLYSGRNGSKIVILDASGEYYVRIYSPDTNPQKYRIVRE